MAKKKRMTALKTVGSTTVDDKLRKDFSKNEPKCSKTKELQQLSKKYAKQLNQPVMTTANLITAMRYINKHNVTENKYGKVIAKVGASHPVLRQKDFSDIYDSIMANCSDQNKITYHNARFMWRYFIKYLKGTLAHFMNFRLWHFGTFVMRHSKSGKYYNPSKKKICKKPAHDKVLFHPNTDTKKLLSTASKNK